MLLFADLNHAHQLYKQKNYTAAISEAKKSTNSYGNAKLHLIWARSAKALGRNVEAMSAYERVLIFQPNNLEAKKALARIYTKLNKPKLAIQIVKQLKEENVDFKEFRLLNIKNKILNYSIKSAFTLGTGYDTNINVHGEESELDAFYGTTIHTNKIASKFYRATLNMEYMNQFGENMYLKGRINGYYNIYSETNLYNVFLNTYRIGAGYYEKGKYNFFVPITYSKLKYLREDLLDIYSIYPQFDIFWTDDIIVSLKSKLQKRKFNEDNKGRDDQSISVGAGLYYKFGKNLLYVDVDYERYTSTDETPDDFVNKKTLTFLSGVNYLISPTIKASLSYKVRFGDYEDTLGTILNPSTETRSDTFHQLSIRLSKQLRNNLELFVENEYSKNDTNYIPAKYDKNTFMLGIGLKF
jgi:tetratricopeptide (TPR) repeat protein